MEHIFTYINIMPSPSVASNIRAYVFCLCWRSIQYGLKDFSDYILVSFDERSCILSYIPM
jgi:hypothetical protein